jgi:capsular polysaccharide biosynthesis protein
MDIRWTVGAIRRHWLVVAIAAVGLGAMAGVLTYLTTPEYSATARGVVSVTWPDSRPTAALTSGSLYIQARLTSYARLATTSTVLDSVTAELRPAGTGRSLRDEVSARNEVDTAFLDVTVQDQNPAVAARAADAVLAKLRTTIGELESGAVQLAATGPAAVPTVPSNRHITKNVGLAAVGGAVLGMVLAVLIQLVAERRAARSAGEAWWSSAGLTA